MTEPVTDLHGEALLDGAYLAVLSELPNFALSDDALGAVRGQLTAMPGFEASGEVTHTDRTITGPDGNEIVLRVYRPVMAEGVLPCVYAIHGGGYVLGSYDMMDPRFDVWCSRFGCVGVSVEYRLAPEHPYPAPLEDCYAGLKWVHDHHEHLKIDPSRVGIQGTSAGGGLAAALALLVRDRGELPMAFQILECPMIDDRQVTASSKLDKLAVWSRESNTYGWRAYLGDHYGRDDIPYHAAPARATDLRGLPPAFVAVGGADGFRDEDVLYGLRLLQAGVPTELHVYPGAPHGAQIVPTAPAAKQWERDVEDWLRRQLTTDA